MASKKDYENAAKVIKDMADELGNGKNASFTIFTINQIYLSFLRFFNNDPNPRFDIARFHKACFPSKKAEARKP